MYLERHADRAHEEDAAQALGLDWVDDHLKLGRSTARRGVALKSPKHRDAAVKLVAWPTTDSP
jgi:hypothetical protein